MHNMKIKAIIATLALAMATATAITSANTPTAPVKNGPDLPSPLCDRLRVDEGNKLHSQVYADGVQVYHWDGLSWVFVEPIATLFANANYNGKVGKHYVGPTWESNSGSKVVGTRMYGMSARPYGHSMVVTRGGLGDGTRHLRLGDLHPAREHERWFGAGWPGLVHWGNRPDALHG
jgi:Protein of unknown function (DUF3455)